jgi:hypothetical protein
MDPAIIIYLYDHAKAVIHSEGAIYPTSTYIALVMVKGSSASLVLRRGLVINPIFYHNK